MKLTLVYLLFAVVLIHSTIGQPINATDAVDGQPTVGTDAVLPTGTPDIEESTNITSTNGTHCPRYPTRYEDEDLVIEIEKGECEMIVSSVNIHQENVDRVKSFKKRVKNILRKVNVPAVSFRPLMTISELGSNNETTGINNVTDEQTNVNTEHAKPCTTTGHRYVGPVLVIDTLPGQCQMMIVVNVGQNHENVFKRLNKKGKPQRGRKNILFEYIDDSFF